MTRWAATLSAIRKSSSDAGSAPTHTAVAVERREGLGELERVGGDAVRAAPLGRLGDLGGEREQLLDQLALGRVQRRPAATPAPSARSTRSSPALASIDAIRAWAYCT